MNIDAIQNGIVIDHITAGRGMRIYELLGLDTLEASVAIIKNAVSHRTGAKKDMIKIDSDIAINFDVLGFVDPGVTVNIIRNGELVEKRRIDMPQRLTNVIRCKNPRCITSVERSIEHVFKLTDPQNKVYRCLYCETRAQ
ncbi:MAG: aspartate carbamoyltransferase regulatory subunit [Clostridia bacterium]|nr:aspartate carbamoyltransferase regulatory subunit [Clostridia bacterium]MBQ8972680.1 aspartate carbamoyltransferase regulatory subunit [Clostridia bacterium]